MIIFLILIIFLLFIINIILYKKTLNINQYNKEIDIKNYNLKEKYNEIEKELKNIESEYFQQKHQLSLLTVKKDNVKIEFDELQNILENQKKTLDSQELVLNDAFLKYCNLLENRYKEVEEEYDNDILALQQIKEEAASVINKKIEEEKNELEKIRSTRIAAQEALNREEQIKANMDFYCLQLSKNDLQDYDKMNSLKPMLNNPRVLSMLLWQTYFQPLAKKQFPLILGTGVKTGIYKITNQLTSQSYIGQAVNEYRPMKNFSLLS